MFTGGDKQLTIFVAETDQNHSRALYMAIMEMPREQARSAATAVRGIIGLGMSSPTRTGAIVRPSPDLPLVSTVDDRAERIERVLEPLREMVPNVLID